MLKFIKIIYMSIIFNQTIDLKNYLSNIMLYDINFFICNLIPPLLKINTRTNTNEI